MGAGIEDPDGNIYIDMSAGVAVSSVGRNHPKVVEAVKAQSERLMHSAGLISETTVALAEKLSSVMPEGLAGECFTWFGLSGSSAVETAIKFAKAITGRSQIVAFEGAYHGVFHGTLALTTRENFRTSYRPFMPGAIHLPYAYCYRCFADLKYPSCNVACAKYVDYKLTTPNTGADDVAAVVVEPMQADGGYLDPPVEFLQHAAGDLHQEGHTPDSRRGSGWRRTNRQDVVGRAFRCCAGHDHMGEGHRWRHAAVRRNHP